MLEPGQVVIGDKGFAGAEFEQHVASLGGHLLRPDRKDEPPRYGSLGGIRQWIESTFDTLKDQLSLERHGGRTLTGLVSRIARRLLALTAAILHNWQTRQPRPQPDRLRPLRNQSSRRRAGQLDRQRAHLRGRVTPVPLYLALGDSISIDDYTGVVGGGAPSQLARKAGLDLIDLTRDGNTTEGVLADLAQAPGGADVVTLTAGGNDLLDRSAAGRDPAQSGGDRGADQAA